MSSKNDPNWGLVSTFPEISGLTIGKGAEAFLREAYEDWYHQKHSKPTEAMVAWFNLHEPGSCPHCGSDAIIRFGKTANGTDRYRCLPCGRTFTPTTGTIFDSFKIPPSEWMEFLLHLFEFHSVKTAARDNRNADSTGKYWLLKVFKVLRGIQGPIVLREAAVIDEFSVRDRGGDAWRKADGSLPRGMSSNRILVATGTDPWTNRAFAIEAGRGKLSASRCLKAYAPHLGRGAWVVHDMEKSHGALFSELGLYGESYDSELCKALRDRENPLWAINNLHSYLRDFLESHPSFERALFQDWLNLFIFIWDDPADRREKVALFMELAMRCRTVMRYRDVMGRKTADAIG